MDEHYEMIARQTCCNYLIILPPYLDNIPFFAAVARKATTTYNPSNGFYVRGTEGLSPLKKRPPFFARRERDHGFSFILDFV